MDKGLSNNIKDLIRQRVGVYLYDKCEFIIDKIPMLNVRKLSIGMYAMEVADPFKYFCSNAFSSGVILFVINVFFMIMARKNIITIVAMGFVGFGVGMVLEYNDMKRIYINKEREMGIQFSRFASHCVLFISSGVSVRNSFIMSVSVLKDGELLQILQPQLLKLKAGESLSEVCADLSKYVLYSSFNAFLSTLAQMEKYGDYKIIDLQREIDEVWQERKNKAISAGKEMETKLVFSGMLIFMGVMGMVTSAMLLKLVAM